MITLISILSIWGIISTVRLNKICKKSNSEFNPLEGTLLDCYGFIIGLITFSISIVYLFTKYLP